MKNYWFRPKKFWKWFAFYYPASFQGWIATGVMFGVGVYLFSFIDSRSHSGSDTLINFAPWVVALLTIFDMLCFRFGEYPSWWRNLPSKIPPVGGLAKQDFAGEVTHSIKK